MMYRTCPHCGANLDPNEVCDCRASMKAEAVRLIMMMTDAECAALLKRFQKEVPAGAANADEDGVEHVDHSVSASIITQN